MARLRRSPIDAPGSSRVREAARAQGLAVAVAESGHALSAKDYNPRPGLVAGTYAGATVGMAVGARIAERLDRAGRLGRDDGVAKQRGLPC